MGNKRRLYLGRRGHFGRCFGLWILCLWSLYQLNPEQTEVLYSEAVVQSRCFSKDQIRLMPTVGLNDWLLFTEQSVRGWMTSLKQLKMPNTMLSGWDLRTSTMSWYSRRDHSSLKQEGYRPMLWTYPSRNGLGYKINRDLCCTMQLEKMVYVSVMSLLGTGLKALWQRFIRLNISISICSSYRNAKTEAVVN